MEVCLSCDLAASRGLLEGQWHATVTQEAKEYLFITARVDALKKQETNLMNACYHIIRTSGFDRKTHPSFVNRHSICLCNTAAVTLGSARSSCSKKVLRVSLSPCGPAHSCLYYWYIGICTPTPNLHPFDSSRGGEQV